MRVWIKYLLGMVAVVVVLIAAYGEFVVDFRGPRSQLKSENALAAITSTSYGDRDAKVKEARAKYGDRVRAHDSVPAGTVDGKWTITLDGSVLEEGSIVVTLAGMYGILAITSDDATEGIFSFSIVPGRAELSHTTSVKNLRNRFENFPAKFLGFADTDMAVDSCAAPPMSELGFGSIGTLLGMQAQTYCMVHWNATHPSSMLISVTLANGDPWMRPFARWICRSMTLATLRKLTSPDRQPPTYAACVLVDRADRRRPGDAHDTFESVVYEIRDGTLARMN
ncbi:MAG TPA: hypothetical protein VEF90_15915 [Xanthobacteraceae bacterium]|nr:hypothetical protein [Xanthobacteraceae bacterium]